jgi:hypothetical protein
LNRIVSKPRGITSHHEARNRIVKRLRPGRDLDAAFAGPVREHVAITFSKESRRTSRNKLHEIKTGKSDWAAISMDTEGRELRNTISDHPIKGRSEGESFRRHQKKARASSIGDLKISNSDRFRSI